MNTFSAREFARLGAWKLLAFVALTVVFAFLAVPLVVEWQNKAQSRKIGLAMKELNLAAGLAKAQDKIPPPGIGAAAMAGWYRKNGFLNDNGVLTTGLYYHNGVWAISSLTVLPNKWRDFLRTGQPSEGQLKEMLIRFTEMDYATILELAGRGTVILTPAAQQKCELMDSAAELIWSGNTLLCEEDVVALTNALNSFSEKSPNNTFVSSWLPLLIKGGRAGGWVPSSNRNASFSFHEAARAGDSFSAEMAAAFGRFPPGTSVREDLEAALILRHEEFSAPKALLKYVVEEWAASGAGDEIKTWAAPLPVVFSKFRAVLPKLFSEMATIPPASMPLKFFHSRNIEGGSVSTSEARIPLTNGHVYHVRTDRYQFPAQPAMSRDIQTIRCQVPFDAATIMACSYRKYQNGGVVVRNSISIAGSWNFSGPTFTIHSIVGAGTGKDVRGPSEWAANDLWGAAFGEGFLKRGYFSTRGRLLAPENSYYWAVETPFIKKIRHTIESLGAAGGQKKTPGNRSAATELWLLPRPTFCGYTRYLHHQHMPNPETTERQLLITLSDGVSLAKSG